MKSLYEDKLGWFKALSCSSVSRNTFGHKHICAFGCCNTWLSRARLGQQLGVRLFLKSPKACVLTEPEHCFWRRPKLLMRLCVLRQKCWWLLNGLLKIRNITHWVVRSASVFLIFVQTICCRKFVLLWWISIQTLISKL